VGIQKIHPVYPPPFGRLRAGSLRKEGGEKKEGLTPLLDAPFIKIPLRKGGKFSRGGEAPSLLNSPLQPI
jgi:hypothetical protein